jgi:hypothetical protein
VVSVALTLLGQRWLRNKGGVDCDLYWQPTRGEGSVDSPGGARVLERQLSITFLNRKDIPVTVRSMQVVFYKAGKPLSENERPDLTLLDGGRRPLDLVNLPPHEHVTKTISVEPGHNQYDKQRAVEEADQVGFEANIDGAKDIRLELALWSTREPQTEHQQRPWWRRLFEG